MTALSTYSDLVACILSYLARDDDGDNIPTATFIELSEKEFDRRLRTHFQETISAITTTAATSTYAIPADCLNIREITANGQVLRTVDYQSPAAIDSTYRNEHVGLPQTYTIEGQNIRVWPAPDSDAYTITIKYYQALTPLDDTHTNPIFTNYPDLYLNAALVEAMVFLGEDDGDARTKYFMSRREQLFQEIQDAEAKFKQTSGPITLAFHSPNRRRRW